MTNETKGKVVAFAFYSKTSTEIISFPVCFDCALGTDCRMEAIDLVEHNKAETCSECGRAFIPTPMSPVNRGEGNRWK